MPCDRAATLAAQQPNFLTSGATAAAADIRAIGWTSDVQTADQASFSFKVQLKPQAGVAGHLDGVAQFYDGGEPWRTVLAPVVTVKPPVVYNTPVTETFPAAQDAFIDGGLPNSNYGGWGQLFVRSDDLVRALYQFDLSSINALYPVDKATLAVYVDGFSGGGSPAKLQAFDITTAWNQSAVTWKLPWTVPGGDAGAATGNAAISSTSVGQWVELDVTELAKQWVLHPSTNNGALLRAVNGAAFASFGLASSEYFVPGKEPALTITYGLP